jgi:CxxC-x17-CxxC domain-containing protein
MPDLEITCAECGTTFPFTEREQDYYRERGLTHPKRCKPCRDARRQNFGGQRQGGGGGGGERERFEIVCDQCGKSDSVPFKPQPGRPVLCGECLPRAARNAARNFQKSATARQRPGEDEIKVFRVLCDFVSSGARHHVVAVTIKAFTPNNSEKSLV